MEVLSLAYPRREKPDASPYPDTLPENLFASSYDEQQRVLRLELTRTSYHHLVNEKVWYFGLTACRRTDACMHPPEKTPEEGLTLEWLLKVGEGLLPGTEEDYVGHESISYITVNKVPAYPPRVEYIETAEYTKNSLSVFDGILNADEVEKQLAVAGWISVPVPFQESVDFRVWAGRRGYTDYSGPDGFYRPSTQRQTLLTGKTHFDWDPHHCALIREKCGRFNDRSRLRLSFSSTGSRNGCK
ncbi:MAG: hypothetical protein CBHOC_1853 [uncultured Caballeronia sp.]|nr:MAG: hypothetical protein CBHOC_1853 [uncultured Caballeronia sp.]